MDQPSTSTETDRNTFEMGETAEDTRTRDYIDNNSSPNSFRSRSAHSSNDSSPRSQRKAGYDASLFEDVNGLWVFGYGSLCWNQGFKYDKSMTGFVKGFSRRFWQGNTTHRGTEKQPGRVATLVKEDEGLVWGRAFQVQGDDALPYLNNRECQLGGYLTTLTTFYPRGHHSKPFPAIIYLATSSNDLWLGDAPLTDIAEQIVECKGNSGYNAEYLLRLAEYMRDTVPEAEDEHLFTLEVLVRDLIKERNLCLVTLMGDNKSSDNNNEQEVQDLGAGAAPIHQQARTGSFQYASRMPSKKLRCLDI